MQNISMEQEKKKPHVVTGLGMILLLMAAAPMDTTTVEPFLTGSTPSFSAPISASSTVPKLPSLQTVATANSIEEEDDESIGESSPEASAASSSGTGRRRPRKSRIVIESNRIIELSSPVDDQTSTTNTATGASSTSSSITDMFEDDEMMPSVLSYLPLNDLTRCRAVNRAFNRHCDDIVPQPGTPGAVFMRFRKGTHRSSSLFPPVARNAYTWPCATCEASNVVSVSHCTHCMTPRSPNDGAVRRLFVGQLRKERTVEFLSWVLAMTCPDIEILHIENHTNAKDTSRGKGCAWVFVKNADDEACLLQLHKRMFVDIDDFGSEGVWFCRSDRSGALQRMAASQAYVQHRPLTLPRQPLVVERPASRAPPNRSANPLHIANSVANTNNEAAKNCGSFHYHSAQSHSRSRSPPVDYQFQDIPYSIAPRRSSPASQMPTLCYAHDPYSFESSQTFYIARNLW